MANKFGKALDSTFGLVEELAVVGKQTIGKTGVILDEIGNSTQNVAKLSTSITGGLLVESESFFDVRAIELEADTKASKLKASMKLKAIDSISKDDSKLKSVEEAIFAQMLEDFSDI